MINIFQHTKCLQKMKTFLILKSLIIKKIRDFLLSKEALKSDTNIGKATIENP